MHGSFTYSYQQPDWSPDFFKLLTSKSKYFYNLPTSVLYTNTKLPTFYLFITQIYLNYQLSNPKNLKPANFSDFQNLPTKNLKPANFFSEIKGGSVPLLIANYSSPETKYTPNYNIHNFEPI